MGYRHGHVSVSAMVEMKCSTTYQQEVSVSAMVEMWSSTCCCAMPQKMLPLVSRTYARVSLHVFAVLWWSESGALVQPSGGNEERGNTLGSCSLAISPKSLGSLAASRTTERIFSRSQPRRR